MAQTGARPVTRKTHTDSIEKLSNLLAAYRRGNESRSLEPAGENGDYLSVSVKSPVLQQLAQFDKLLVALR